MFNRWYRQSGKRLFDLFLVILTLPLILPVMAVVALLTAFNFGRPIFLRQQRLGWRGKPFIIYKFRTTPQARPGQAQLTPFGRFLRHANLDELPEFFNVLKGDMSLVGPRPLLTTYLDQSTPDQVHQRRTIRPGLTGWNQINNRVNLEWETRLAMDIWYIDNLSLWLDLKILAWTPLTVVGQKTLSRPGAFIGPDFRSDLDSPEQAEPQPAP